MDIEHKETVKKEVPLATEIIRTMKKIIFSLIILIVFIVGGFIWYLSLPVEVTETESTVTQNVDNGSENSYIGGDYNSSTSGSEEKDNSY